MKRINKIIQVIKDDNRIGKRIFLITLLMALFILAVNVKDHNSNTKYETDKNGNVVSIVRGKNNTSESYYFDLELVNGSTNSKRSIKINKQAAKDALASDKQTAEENSAMEIEAEISGIVTEIEMSDKKTIMLPRRLSDGTRLYWSLKKEGISSWIYLPLVYVGLILLVLKGSVDSKEEPSAKLRKEIVRGLPRFTNQLLLMMNAGVILSDAFEYICNSYEILGNENMDVFQKELLELKNNNPDHRTSTAILINDYAGKHNVKELMRISTILLENEKRGSDVIENLNRESKYLWDDRKLVARESGKMIDTKMTYPMAILLLLLIVITMAPALLNL